jgi:hypothetical protein
MRIYKETILRMPPQGFERWVAVHSLQGMERFYRSFSDGGFGEERLVACGDAVWKQPVGVTLSYLKGYMTGGPIGFSMDLTLLSESAFAAIRAHVTRMKEEREFWQTAVARILCDTPTVTAYQYSDIGCDRAVIQLLTGMAKQTSFRVYPVLDPSREYTDPSGRTEKGKEKSLGQPEAFCRHRHGRINLIPFSISGFCLWRRRCRTRNRKAPIRIRPRRP